MVGNGFLAELVARLRITDLPVHGRFVLNLERQDSNSHPQYLYF